MPNRLAAVVRGLIALAAATGITIDCVQGDPLVVFSFFTIWSNTAVAVVLGLGAARAWTGRPPLPAVWSGGALLCICVVGLVFHLVLANPSSPFNQAAAVDALTGARAVSNQLLHTVTPLGVALDWLLLTHPGAFRPRFAALWLAAPGAYLLFALARGALLPADARTRYTYPFLDVAAHGYAGVLVNALALGLAFSALGLLLVLADRFRPAVAGRRNRISSLGAGGLK
ncbi:Pr6Pr family membrane protein [Streptomyces sp. CC208A]|uniref:Pr6Pr family membrane protein n=1 Tax=Streptomyces sp. CC208A TaxID=3044573 RepID=UPI0024A90E5A|nr:Pr6Pr family membrane protein [Streptomyces sp. CC208A]